jgi:hypothetical protein
MTFFSELYTERKNEIVWHQTKIVPYMRFQMPDGAWVEYQLGEFFPSTPKRVSKGDKIYREVELYDDTIILLDKKFEISYTITQGTSYDVAIRGLLNLAGITKQNIQTSGKTLEVTVVYNGGTSYMEAIKDLLIRINYVPLFVDSRGYFTSFAYRLPSTQAPVFSFADSEFSVMYDGVEEELDYFRIPNRFIFVHTNAEKNTVLKSTLTNTDGNSPTSTVVVGRTITHYEEVSDIESQAVLDSYAKKKSYELSQVFGTVGFATANIPNFEYQDVIELRNSALGINDKFLVTKYTLDLKIGGQMKFEVQKVVDIDGITN